MGLCGLGLAAGAWYGMVWDAQQTDKLQEDKLRKLQAGQRLRQILMGDSFSEGEGSSQGSETESEQEEGAHRMERRQVKVFCQQRFSQRQREKGKRNSRECLRWMGCLWR